jgi:hypothetical protein
MFFDSLGHGFKDFTILLFIIFTIVLSIYIISLNSSLHWWEDNRLNPVIVSDTDHGPNDTAVVISSVFLGIVGLTVLYCLYRFFAKS